MSFSRCFVQRAAASHGALQRAQRFRIHNPWLTRRPFSTKDGEESDLDFSQNEIGADDVNRIVRGEGVRNTDVNFSDVLNPDNAPDLTIEHYEQLKSIDFKGRETIIRDQSLAKADDWDAKLTALHEQTQAEAQGEEGFAFSEAERARIAEIDDQWQDSAETFQEGLGVKPKETVEFQNMPGHDDMAQYNEVLEAGISANPALMYEDLDFSSEFMPRASRNTYCIFCAPDNTPRKIKTITYTNIQLLVRFINERGMIKSRSRTFVCAKHQRKVRGEIKKARYMGLLNYQSNFYVPQSFVLDDDPTTGSSKLESSKGFQRFKEVFDLEQHGEEELEGEEDEMANWQYTQDYTVPDTISFDDLGTQSSREDDAVFREKEREKMEHSKERKKLKAKQLKISREERFNELLGAAAEELKDSRTGPGL